MTLENQVVSLDLAKRLKELGFKQESLFYWSERPETIGTNLEIKPFLHLGLFHKTDTNYSAYTVAELGEMLPEEYPGDSDSILACYKFNNDIYFVRYENDDTKEVYHSEKGDTEADARAKMLIYLKENKFNIT